MQEKQKKYETSDGKYTAELKFEYLYTYQPRYTWLLTNKENLNQCTVNTTAQDAYGVYHSVNFSTKIIEVKEKTLFDYLEIGDKVYTFCNGLLPEPVCEIDRVNRCFKVYLSGHSFIDSHIQKIYKPFKLPEL